MDEIEVFHVRDGGEEAFVIREAAGKKGPPKHEVLFFGQPSTEFRERFDRARKMEDFTAIKGKARRKK